MSRKKVELLLWANILNLCSAVLTNKNFVMKDGWGGSPWICRGRRCHTREEHLPTEQTHIRVSCRLRGAEKHEDESDKSTNIRMGRDVNRKGRHANSDSCGWPKDICSTRAGIGCEGSAWLQWKCQEFVQRQERGCELLRSSAASPHSTATPPLTEPPLCIWHREVGWGARPAAATSHPLMTDHLFPPPKWELKTAAAGVALVVCPDSEHQHMWMLHLPSLHCQRTDTDATTVRSLLLLLLLVLQGCFLYVFIPHTT